MWALNHHGDGHVALWLNTPALEQSRLLASSRHIFKPPYVGPSGWIGVELNKGVSLEAGLRARAHGLREQLAREARRAQSPEPPVVAAPTREDEARRDRSHAGAEGAQGARRAARDLRGAAGDRRKARRWARWSGASASAASSCCTTTARDSPRSSGWASSGRVRSKWIRDCRSRAYMGHKGWMELDLADLDLARCEWRELREFVIESYRHFASRRAIAALDAQLRVA